MCSSVSEHDGRSMFRPCLGEQYEHSDVSQVCQKVEIVEMERQ